MVSRRGHDKDYPGRLGVVGLVFAVAVAGLAWRLIELQVLDCDFLRGEGEARHLRVVKMPAHRGIITDRHGEPLAVSTPVASIWFNPQLLGKAREQWRALAKAAGVSMAHLEKRIKEGGEREFVYLNRWVEPDVAQRVQALDIPGVNLQSEYRRYYPAGPVAAHVVGFTNIDDRGQEGLELAFDETLRGIPGKKRVIQDSRGRVVEDVENLRVPRPGRDLRLSIDLRLQYLAYRELKTAVQAHNARAGSLVILDVGTGEVLAMVNQPSYNPNDRSQLKSHLYRNRAVTDLFEPGSTIKPFTIGIALESGKYYPHTPIDTAPGYFRVGRYTIRDIRNYGRIDVSTVIKKSSNVGASKIALSLDPQRLWQGFSQAGLGASTASGFPGEAEGHLPNPRFFPFREIEQATLAFGYGLSVTPLQLARAYAALGAGGELKPVSFLYREQAIKGRQVWSEGIAPAVLSMLEEVISDGGTGERAYVPSYRVAGKTGTVKKATRGGYAKERYLAVFAGLIPASHPRLAAVVLIDEPQGKYYGGQVAAPVFSQVMIGAMRLLNIAPDNLPPLRLAERENSG
ncbi:peptidoglycan synthetase FtsI [Nitrosococcus oceani ATCC 19707]|uniref:Peptidoglycan D,D-transpeptidase FtsI n=2 Tax=Nitrosococcus oceani TaxID=1229 RepID=Q3J783_NITOC|nr:penicillin-binding transpeptidase domain-containing protein [Nitrosococcus oceani]ABA59313.1 peptidoglycan synthetase FtsI [Nitrosococcus oceani ATCC 19707]EDZ65740.1 Penicillin-binding Protein dimerisation domain family [Nitrosococcus oceani AFC27]KFI18341.1 cell division protein [Nitrosococcus oceani C-27]GEM21139.1 cell division protein [Nitrosococcus oceani]